MYYKLLDKQMGSYSVFSTDPIYVRYEIGKWAYPKDGCGPLCAFETLEDAVAFDARLYKTHLVYSCRIIKSTSNHVWAHQEKQFKLPPGTVLCNAIMLLAKL